MCHVSLDGGSIKQKYLKINIHSTCNRNKKKVDFTHNDIGIFQHTISCKDTDEQILRLITCLLLIKMYDTIFGPCLVGVITHLRMKFYKKK